MTDVGSLLRSARRRRGVSQKRLAIRARTTRSAISQIERDKVSPSVETLEELLFLLGEDLVLSTRKREANVDLEAIRERLRLTPGERIRRGIDEANRAIAKAQRKAAEGSE